MTHTKQEIMEAKQSLKRLIKPGSTVYTACTHVSRSGMMRYIKCYIVKKNEIVNIDWYIERVTGYKSHDYKGLKVQGCGMDMGFHLVYSLGRCLWPKGARKFSHNRNGDPGRETDGGYLLNHTWI